MHKNETNHTPCEPGKIIIKVTNAKNDCAYAIMLVLKKKICGRITFETFSDFINLSTMFIR